MRKINQSWSVREGERCIKSKGKEDPSKASVQLQQSNAPYKCFKNNNVA